MPTLSPLATLAATLATVCRQAQQHQQLLSKNEAATRAVLIDPVLRALGWDTSDVTMVEPERTVQNKQSLDYVLKTASGNILAVVEAKKLGEPLDKLGHVGAVIGYAFSLKPTSFFITDGLNWHCYSPGHSQFEPIASMQLCAESLLPAALQLLQLLDAAHGGHGLTQLAPPRPAAVVLESAVKPLNPPQKSQVTKIPKAAKPILTKPNKAYVVLSSTLALDAPGKPVWLRLPDGSEHPLQSWKDILVAACNLVVRTRPDLTLPLPDKTGKKTALLRREKPANGLSFKTINYQGHPAYIYTNYSAVGCLANALYVLNLLPKEQHHVEAAIAFGN